MTVLHFIIAGMALASLIGSLWLGSEAAQVMVEDINSHTAEWRDIGASAVILGAVICTVVTSLYALTCAAL